MAVYSVELRRSASTTASVGSITADSTRPRRGSIAEMTVGCHDTPADLSYLWRVRRCTAAGTSTSVTPVAVIAGDAATETDAGENHTVEPTYTANTELILIPLNQKATFRWVASGPKRQPTWPATAANGCGVDTPTAGGTPTIAALIYFEEE